MNNALQIGSIVKALDFAGNNDYYYIGTVTQIHEDMIYILSNFRVQSANMTEMKNPIEVRFPKQGAHFMDEQFPRVFLMDALGKFIPMKNEEF